MADVKEERPRGMQRLAARWGVSTGRALLILLVFICTGCTVVLLKKPLIAWLFADGEKPLWFSILYYVFILPVYNVFLLLYGAVFGQFGFFWDYERRFFKRLFGGKQ